MVRVLQINEQRLRAAEAERRPKTSGLQRPFTAPELSGAVLPHLNGVGGRPGSPARPRTSAGVQQQRMLQQLLRFARSLRLRP